MDSSSAVDPHRAGSTNRVDSATFCPPAGGQAIAGRRASLDV